VSCSSDHTQEIQTTAVSNSGEISTEAHSFPTDLPPQDIPTPQILSGEPNSTLDLDVSPKNASVKIDQVLHEADRLGHYKAKLSAKTVSIEVTCEGYQTYREVAEIGDRRMLKYAISLTPDPASILKNAKLAFYDNRPIRSLELASLLLATHPEHVEALELRFKILLALSKPKLAKRQLDKLMDLTNEKEFEQESYQLAFALGESTYQDGDYQSAIKYFDQAKKLKPKNARGLRFSGMANEKLRLLTPAISDLSQAVDISKAELYDLARLLERCLLDRAYQYRNAQDLPAALADLNSILEGSPNEQAAMQFRASILDEMGSYREAEEQLLELLKLVGNKSEKPVVEAQRAGALMGQEKYGAAVELLSKLSLATPDDVGIMKQLGYCYGQMGLHQKATEIFSTALRQLPADPQLLRLRGMAFGELKQFGLSARDLASSISNNPTPDADKFFELALALENAGDNQKSLHYYTLAIEVDGNFVPALLNRSVLLVALKKYESAIGDASAVLLVDPKDVTALNNRGVALASIGEYLSAIDDLSNAVNLAPNYADGWFNRGAVRVQQQKHELAIEDFSRAIELDKATMVFQIERIKSRIKIGDFDSATAELNGILKLHPKDPVASKLLGDLNSSQMKPASETAEGAPNQ